MENDDCIVISDDDFDLNSGDELSESDYNQIWKRINNEREKSAYVVELDLEPELSEESYKRIGELYNNLESQSLVKTECNLFSEQTGFGALDAPSTSAKRGSEADALPSKRQKVVPIIEWRTLSSETHNYPKFRKSETLTTIKMGHNLGHVNLLDVDTMVDDLFKKFISEQIKDAGDNDRVTVSLNHSELSSHIYINFTKKNFDKQSFLNRVFKVVQSNERFLLDGKLQVTLRVIKDVSGSGRPRTTIAPRGIEDRSRNRRCVVRIINDNNSCGYLAIALGKFIADMTPKDEAKYKTIVRQNNNKLMDLALRLCYNAAVDINVPLNTSETLRKIQQYLQDYQIIVVNAEDNTKLFMGDTVSEKYIVLEYINNHFNVIKSLKAYLGFPFFCIPCWKGFHRQNRHQCPSGCDMCLSSVQCSGIKNYRCNFCNRDFYSLACYERHRQIKVCEKIRVCNTCNFQYSGDSHTCDKYICEKCGDEYEHNPHYCMMKTLDCEKLKKEDEKFRLFVAYDIESVGVKERFTSQNNMVNIESDEEDYTYQVVHRPILVIAKVACNICDNSNNCTHCNGERKIFYGLNCVKQFNDYLINTLAIKAERLKSKVYVFAHNQKGYDGHFVIRDMFNRSLGKESVIMQGSKILLFVVGNVRFVDSLSFFHQPLDNLPKCFGFENTAKGFFPHLFNTLENQNFVGPMPPQSYFSPEFMKPKTKHSFEVWYDENKNGTFNLKQKMIDYCANDVEILMKSLMEFRKLFKSITGLDPTTRCFTLASVGLEYFRSKVLTDNTMAITPTYPYGKVRMSSRKENIWLDWIELTDGPIERQQRIGPFYCDGKKDNTVYEFWGCYWHGCEKCFPDRFTCVSIGGEEICVTSLYEKVQQKREYFRSRNMNLVECWEHDFDEFGQDSRFKNFFNSRNEFYNKHGDGDCLDIRDAFFGGRTNNLVFSHECKDDEEILYVDFTSLYPFVLCKYDYPVGHPSVIRENFGPLEDYFGFVKCNIQAPPDLNIAVLPAKHDNKLMFPLCTQCAQEKNQSCCQHTFSERILKGTWTTVELNTARSYNYVVDEIFEILHYPPEKRSSTLFKKFVRDWYKVKAESSGYPSWCLTDDLKQKFVEDFHLKEGVVLDQEAIEFNPGKRFIAKLVLNALWGKFAQRCNLRKTEIVKDYARYWQLLSDEKIEILSEFTVSNEATILEYENTSVDDCDPGKTNIAVASFVTAYARIELFKLMQKIESIRPGRVLYFDTDSVIFIQKKTDPTIETGDFLGELTNEIEQNYGVGAKCKKFVSCGPKNYGIEVTLADGTVKSEMKIKGLTLHAKSLETVDLTKMEEIALNYIEGSDQHIEVPQWGIFSDKHTHIVKSRYLQKKYRAVSEKRRIDGNGTLPYGYIDR